MPPPSSPSALATGTLGSPAGTAERLRHAGWEAPQLLNTVAMEGLVLGLVLRWSFLGHFGIIWAPRALSPLGAC